MEIARQRFRLGITVPSLDEVKLVLARATVGREHWDLVSMSGGKVTILAFQNRVDEVTTAMEDALQSRDYWFKSFNTPLNWTPMVRRIEGVYYVLTSLYSGGMDDLIKQFHYPPSLAKLWLEAQFSPAEDARAGDLFEWDLGPVAEALRGTRLANFTAAQLATAICQGTMEPGLRRPNEAGRVVLFLDSLACILLEVDKTSVAGFTKGWRHKDGQPGTIVVPLRRDTSMYEREQAGAVYAPSLRFIITGAVEPEIHGPPAFYGANDNNGLPVVTPEHEDYLFRLASELEASLRAVNAHSL